MLVVIFQVFYKKVALLTVSDIALKSALSVLGRTPSRRGSVTRVCTAYAKVTTRMATGCVRFRGLC